MREMKGEKEKKQRRGGGGGEEKKKKGKKPLNPFLRCSVHLYTAQGMLMDSPNSCVSAAVILYLYSLLYSAFLVGRDSLFSSFSFSFLHFSLFSSSSFPSSLSQSLSRSPSPSPPFSCYVLSLSCSHRLHSHSFRFPPSFCRWTGNGPTKGTEQRETTALLLPQHAQRSASASFLLHSLHSTRESRENCSPSLLKL